MPKGSNQLVASIHPEVDGTSLIKGPDVIGALGVFDWAIVEGNAMRIPSGKRQAAYDALREFNYRVYGPGAARQPRPLDGRNLPLPECSMCGQPYRRTHRPGPLEECVDCGKALLLIQYDDRNPEAHHRTVSGE
jgi:hypothetical protein